MGILPGEIDFEGVIGTTFDGNITISHLGGICALRGSDLYM
jgi:hypothetical protein